MTVLNAQTLTIYRLPGAQWVSTFRSRFTSLDKAGDFIAIAIVNAQLVYDRAEAQRKLGYADDFDTAGYFICRGGDLERAASLEEDVDIINLLDGDDALIIGDRTKLNDAFMEIQHIKPETYRAGRALYHYIFFRDVKTDETKVDAEDELRVDV